jgi:O-antigen biosynthesis protein
MGTSPETAARPPADAARIAVRGKFFEQGGEKFAVCGVTYGTFAPDASGDQFPSAAVVESDFRLMNASGINTVRTYTPPPVWLLDLALKYDLRVMVGVPWPQHLMFLDDSSILESTIEAVRTTVMSCSGHPALFAFAIGNEIPASIVRWYGRRRIERFLHRLYRVARAIDPLTPITYVNFPTTEYLQLPFLDFVAFNVYLETPEKLRSYLARLQNIAGDRPLVMAEIGLDSRRNGHDVQATSLGWQVRAAFEEGCAGTFVFAWTDEWYRGGFEIDDWDFGLVTRDRELKPAFDTVRRAYRVIPPKLENPPMISVVVCSFNGSRTIRECLEGIAKLDYPSYEVIVVDDGSTDTTASIAREFDVTLISTPNRGLSSARNTGWQTARGEIVAYIDDDATPHVDWLSYLAIGYRSGEFGGMGGPNIQPVEDDAIAHCVASAPGGPMHVLTNDRIAEHIPGCNMSFRRHVLEEIGGFDTRFRIAGDDVDICWRVQDAGYVIGFHAGAMVWHHRRNRVKIYWKQQRNYGRAEAMLEQKWPEKYNRAGHAVWHGRLYGNGHRQFLSWHRGRVYHGVWGSAPFQSEDAPVQTITSAMPLMPEWHLVTVGLVIGAALGLLWSPLLVALPLALAALGIVATDSILGGLRAPIPRHLDGQRKLRAITAWLYFLQPLARLAGRISFGLTPWRVRTPKAVLPVPRKLAVWSEGWHESSDWIERLRGSLRDAGAVTRSGGPYDRWDLSVRGGLTAGARVLVGVEDHGAGRQYVRVAVRPVVARSMVIALLAFVALGGAAYGGARLVSMLFFDGALGLGMIILAQAASAVGLAMAGVEGLARATDEELAESVAAGNGASIGLEAGAAISDAEQSDAAESDVELSVARRGA